MRPLRFLLTVGTVGTLLLPDIANAKSFSVEQVTIRGPGLSAPLVTGERWWRARTDRSPTAVAVEGMLGALPKANAPPPGELGKRYEVTYTLSVIELGTNRVGPQVVVQSLYPFAKPAPLTFTPEQRWESSFGTEVIEPGWQAFPGSLIRGLQALGLPRQPPREIEKKSAPDPSLVFGMPLLLLLALGAVRVLRRDRLRF